jgi:hypothetical protein
MIPEGAQVNNMPGRLQIFEKLRERGLQPVVSEFSEAAFSEDGVRIGEPLLEETVRSLGTVGLEEVAVIVSRIGRSIKRDQLPSPDLPPMINENATRSLAHHKYRSHLEVLAPLGISIPTLLAAERSNIDEFLAQYDHDEMIVKPEAGGTGGFDVVRIDRSAVVQKFEDNPEQYGTQLIQPAYDFSQPFPSYMRPFDRASKEAFEGWSRANVPKEVRIYGLHSPAGTEVIPVCRAIKNGDNWFFVDPESLPSSLITATKNVTARSAEVSMASSVLAATDFGFAPANAAAEPAWHAIEFNGRNPYILGYDKHPVVADLIREAFADQILATTDQS